MSANYYVYCKESHAGVDVYPIDKQFGDFLKSTFDTSWKHETTTKKAGEFTDPSLLIIFKSKPKNKELIHYAKTKSGTPILGSFLIIATSRDGSEPELLNWGQALVCISELDFSKSIPVIINF